MPNLRIPSTVVIEDPVHIDRQVLHAVCFEKKIYEEQKTHSNEEFFKKEEEKKKKFNADIETIALTEVINIRRLFEELDRIQEEREESSGHLRQEQQKPELKSSSTPEVISQQPLLADKINALLAQQDILHAQLKQAQSDYKVAWQAAVSKSTESLKTELESKTNEMTDALSTLMDVQPDQKEALKSQIKALNDELVKDLSSRPSVAETLSKQKTAYDTIMQAEKTSAKKSGADDRHAMVGAKQKVADVAENRHDLMAQIRAAGRAREKFKNHSNPLKGALAYANKVPLESYSKAIHAHTRPHLEKIIEIDSELENNAKEIAQTYQDKKSQIPTKKIDPDPEVPLEKAARFLSKTIEQSARRDKSVLEADQHSSKQFIPQ